MIHLSGVFCGVCTIAGSDMVVGLHQLELSEYKPRGSADSPTNDCAKNITKNVKIANPYEFQLVQRTVITSVAVARVAKLKLTRLLRALSAPMLSRMVTTTAGGGVQHVIATM